MKPTFLLIFIFSTLIIIFISCSPQPATIRGLVYEDINTNNEYDTNDSHITNVLIRSGNTSAYSDTNGVFSISGGIYTSGDITLFLSRSGYAETNLTIELTTSDSSIDISSPLKEENGERIYIPMQSK